MIKKDWQLAIVSLMVIVMLAIPAVGVLASENFYVSDGVYSPQGKPADKLVGNCHQTLINALVGQTFQVVCNVVNSTANTIGHLVTAIASENSGNLITTVKNGEFAQTPYNEQKQFTVVIEVPTGVMEGTYQVRIVIQGVDTNQAILTIDVNVSNPVLTSIEVTSSKVTLRSQETYQFKAIGYDKAGNKMPITPVWHASGGTIAKDSGEYTATTAGDFTVTASADGVSGTATVHVDPGAIAKIVVTPSEVTVNSSDRQQFRATGYDKYGNKVPVTVKWGATGGKIDDSGGLYSATTAGDFTVTASGDGVSGTASVQVNPGALKRIKVTPSGVTLDVKKETQFKAMGYDAHGNLIPISPAWSASGGEISTIGKYSASNRPGVYLVVARVAGSKVYGLASVRINSNLARVVITPSDTSAVYGETKKFEAKGYDGQGNEVPFTAQWSTTGGTIDSNGRYTAGNSPGQYQVIAKATGTSVEGVANVQVRSKLAKIVITAATTRVRAGRTIQFKATGYDSQGDPIPFTAQWKATGGTINSNAEYTPTTKGIQTVTVSASDSDVTGTLSVEVLPEAPPWWTWLIFGGAVCYIISFLIWLFFLRGELRVPCWLWILLGLAGFKVLWMILYLLGWWFL